MSTHFLLPCECGQSVPIQLRQAGQSVRCACGRDLVVPTMRGIRELQPTEISPTKPSATRTWNPTRGLLFGAGSVLIIVGLITIGFNYPRYKSADAFRPSEQELDLTLAQIDNSSPEDLWQLWHIYAKHGMGEHEQSGFVIARNQAQRFLQFVITGGVLVAIGGILVVVPLVMPGGKPG